MRDAQARHRRRRCPVAPLLLALPADAESAHGFAEIDDQLLTLAPVAWTPMAAFLGETMPRIEGFFATDSFLLWRCRELGAAGRLALRGDTTAAAACDLRLE